VTIKAGTTLTKTLTSTCPQASGDLSGASTVPEAVGTGRDSVPLLLLLLAAPASTRSLSILTPCARADALTPQRLRAAART